MRYYRILFSEEYSNQKSIYGSLDSNNIPENLDEFEVLDGKLLGEDFFDKVIMDFVGDKKTILADFQMTLFPWRMVSEGLYSVLSDYQNDSMQFFPISIRYRKAKITYYYLHFLTKINALDKDQTGDSLMNPILKVNMLHSLPDIFCYEDVDPSVFCVSEEVKEKILEMKLTGLDFQDISPLPLVCN